MHGPHFYTFLGHATHTILASAGPSSSAATGPACCFCTRKSAGRDGASAAEHELLAQLLGNPAASKVLGRPKRQIRGHCNHYHPRAQPALQTTRRLAERSCWARATAPRHCRLCSAAAGRLSCLPVFGSCGKKSMLSSWCLIQLHSLVCPRG